MATLAYTPLDDIEKIHAELDSTFRSGLLQDIRYRKYVLLQLGYMLKDNTQLIVDALMTDLGKPAFETHMMELGPSLSEVAEALSHLDSWAKPTKPPFSFVTQPLRRVVYKEGKGVCLIIGPFNYPISMCLSPLVSAIAAGNTVVLKPSESTPALCALYSEIFPKYVDPSIIRIVNGGIAETSKLLELTWGHMLFTGSGRVGRIVAGAAAKTLTPVTLELGGKSPVFVDANCDLETAARRIMWGKVVNCGQSCIAPDYVLVQKDFQDELVAALKAVNDSFFPEGPFDPKAMGKIINAAAFKRIYGLLQKTKGTIAFGGQTDEMTKSIAPTIVKNCSFDDSLMSEEIFGPILPIIPVDTWDDGIAWVNKNDHPLAVYAFTKNGKLKEKLIKSVKSGSIVMNETMMQGGMQGLPFGGVGASGSGFHNGKFGFDTFTHFRASMDSPSWIDLIMKMRYPPYTVANEKRTGYLFPGLPKRPKGPPLGTPARSISTWIMFVLALIFAGGLAKRKVLEVVMTRSMAAIGK